MRNCALLNELNRHMDNLRKRKKETFWKTTKQYVLHILLRKFVLLILHQLNITDLLHEC